MNFDPYSKYHGKIDVSKIVPGYKPIIPRLSKEGSGRLTASHHRASNMIVPNLLTGEKQKRENPLPPEFKSILEVSTRSPYCPISFTLDVNMGYCGMGCIYCVPGGTRIIMADGRVKKIKNIKEGEKTLGYNTEEEVLVTNTVTKLMKRRTNNYYRILFGDDSIDITGEHPVWTKKGWKNAADLSVGEEVLWFDSPILRSYKDTSDRMKLSNPMKNKSIVRKNRDVYYSNKSDRKQSEKMLDRWENDEGYRNIVSDTLTRRNPMRIERVAYKQSQTRKRKIRSGEIKVTSPFLSAEPEQIAEWVQKGFKNSIGNRYDLPSKNEKQLIGLMDEFELPFKYVGDGQLWINNKNPDFVCALDGFHLIEFVGDTFHNDPEEYMKQRDIDLAPHPVLYLFKEDLDTPIITAKKIQKFVTNPTINWRKIKDKVLIEKSTTVYNIEAEGTNNYFAEGLLVHNCFQAKSIESLMTSFFDSDNPMALRWASKEHVRKELPAVLSARGVEPDERESMRGKCGSIGDTNTLKKAAAQRVPLRFGTRSENFLYGERKQRVSLEVLKIVRDMDYPLIINTKSDLLLEEPWFSAICELGDNVAIQESISHNDDKVAKRLEPGAPSSTRRWEVLKAFNDVGITAMVRMEPCAHFLNADDKHLIEYMDKAVESGVKNFMGDVYHHTANQEEVQNLFYENGFDFGRMWEATSEYQGLGSLSFEKAMYYAKKNGIRTGTFNYHSIPWNDDPVCCMVGDQFKTWSKYSLVHILRNVFVEHPNTNISFEDFDKKHYGLELHPAIRERIKEVWNLEKLNCFNPDFMEGMIPVDHDSEGNLVWRFEPKRMGESYRKIEKMFKREEK
jgi:hypothetical protein